MPHARPNDLFAAFLRNAMSLRVLVGALLAIFSIAPPAFSDTPVALYESLAGSINITGTGGTLRTQSDAGDSCQVTNSGTMTLSGIPAGATVRKAYLYWAGSGGDPQGGAPADYDVTFNGTPVSADRTYTASYSNGYNLYFFNGVKDVTAQVTGNGVYTFADLTVQTANIPGGGIYCSAAAVLSAYSLVVVYDDPAETLHVVNIWEGFQSMRGASITLTPSNFVVPSPVPGGARSRVLVMTWEGDSGNSGGFGGFTEDLTFCSPAPCGGAALTDAYNPLNGQFNSTVDIPPSGPFSGIDAVWGLDLDMYDVTAMVPAGAASAETVYSSGGDLVLLSNQTMAFPNVPVADLSITKSHSGNFVVGFSGTYTIGVTNNGPGDAAGTITVTDTLPAGLTYSSATGTGWTCGAVGQDVTCTRPGPLASGASTPDISLTVAVGAGAYPGVTNTASVSNPTFDNVAGNNTADDVTVVDVLDLSTSTKTWLDVNGGDQEPGDVIRYTLTLTNTAAAPVTGVTATDDIPANVTGFGVVSVPPGASNSSTGAGTGANGTGYLSVSNITVPASSSVTIVFDVTIAGGTPAGTLIDNTASITNPSGPGATPSAVTIIVSGSSIPQAGNKQLYLYDNTSTPARMLSRTPPAGGTFVTIANGAPQTWTMSPAAQADITIDPSINPNVPVTLYMRRSPGEANGNRSVTANLQCSLGGSVLTQTQVLNMNATVTLYTFNLPVAVAETCGITGTWNLTISANAAGDTIRVYPYNGGLLSQAVLPVSTVINVDDVSIYDAAYPGGSTLATTLSGTTVYVRSVVSDPFGSYDITGATLIITDPTGTTPVNGVAMTEVADSGTLTKTYEYTFAIPAAGPAGNWTFRVDASEGSEGTISDYGLANLPVTVPAPNILTLKSVSVISDPINTGPPYRAIPGAIMEYLVSASNQGNGSTDSGSFVLEDPIPANAELYVNDLPATTGPVRFTDGALASGLTYTFVSLGDGTDSIEFSNTVGGPPYTYGYTPTPDADGFDGSVTSIRITLGGSFSTSAGPTYPSFSIQFRIRVK